MSFQTHSKQMKCPKCGKEMLEMPVWEEHCKVMGYWHCLHCTHREIKKCKWMGKATFHSPFAIRDKDLEFDWCNHPKLDGPCDPTSEKCGYINCPQIREWQEKQCSWVKRQNEEFEEKRKEQRRLFFAKCKKIFERTQVKK